MKDMILVKEVAEYNNDVEMNERYRRHQWRKRRCHWLLEWGRGIYGRGGLWWPETREWGLTRGGAMAGGCRYRHWGWSCRNWEGCCWGLKTWLSFGFYFVLYYLWINGWVWFLTEVALWLGRDMLRIHSGFDGWLDLVGGFLLK